jgi:hypothetical protein
MRVYIGCDELYPCYYLSETGHRFDCAYDLSEEEIAKVKAGMEAFDEAQAILASAPRIPPPPQGEPLLTLEPGQYPLHDGLKLYATTVPFPFEQWVKPLWFWDRCPQS